MQQLLLISFVFGMVSCGVESPPLPPPCPFSPVTLFEVNERNEASIDLSNELTLELKKLPGGVPVTAEDILSISAGVSRTLDKYTKSPIDVYLAGTINVYLMGTICNTYAMLQQQTDSAQKAFYEKLLQEQFVKLSGFTAIYSTGRDPKPLPGCLPPPPRKGDPAKIVNFINDKVSNAAPSEKEYWEKRRKIVFGHVSACQQSQNPQECLDGLFKEVQEMYNEH